MATPVVSGAAALLLPQNATLTPDRVKARLMKAATNSFPASGIATDPSTGLSYSSYYDLLTIGAGYLDVWAALNNTDVAAGSAISPTATYDSASGNVNVVNTASAVWGTSAVWETSAVWGTSAVWRTGGTQGFSAVWGYIGHLGNYRRRSLESCERRLSEQVSALPRSDARPRTRLLPRASPQPTLM